MGVGVKTSLTQTNNISTGGKTGAGQGPLAALDEGNQNKRIAHYQYPVNLGNDPSRMHVVQFSIRNIIPTQFSERKTPEINVDDLDIVNLGLTGTTSIQSGTAGRTTLQAALTPQKTKQRAVVSLYMPDTLSMSYSQNYDEVTLDEAFGVGGRVGAAAGSLLDSKGGPSVSALGSEALAAGGGNLAAGLAGGNAESAKAILLQATGRAVNPQLQLLYRGPNLRTYSMEFVFTPKSKQEADQVSAIINVFAYASSPTVPADEGSMYFIPPSVFNMDFLMVNIAGAGKGAENKRLYKVGDSILTDMTVDYAPNGWAAHENGAPVQTRLTLNFKEMNIVDRTRMKLEEAR
jgi:hypothetical protein